MRALVIGDIHGAIKALTQVLERAGIQPTNHLIFLDNYANGWSQTPEVLDFLISYQHQQRCLFLYGNHDVLCYDSLQGKSTNALWRLHGDKATEKAYQNVIETRHQAHLDFLASLQDYYLDAQNRLFLHAGFTSLRGIAYEHFPEMYYWDRTLWELAQSSTLSSTDPHYPNRLELYTCIYIGHTPTARLGTDRPLSFNRVANVGIGAVFKGRITIMDIDALQYWQSGLIYTLYPGETGHNQ